ncbi:hypothetical protein [Flavobacterium sp.]|uniref:hypothetical protein n=1 Tax=Flavobacterium sp. TaxID=239 RepID=UPI003528B470
MKKSKFLNQNVLAILFIASSSLIVFSNLSCEEEELCSGLKMADLTIPSLVTIYDQFGTSQTVNELYYNESTGEYFNSANPPTGTLSPGDWIQLATTVFNQFTETECKLGGDAQQTSTAPRLTIQNNQGNTYSEVLQGMPTPFISYGGYGYTATRFQLGAPGHYSVGFNANSNKAINEHSFDNNLYAGQSGNYQRNINSYSFYVAENKKINEASVITKSINQENAPQTVEEMKQLEIYKFLESGEYATWLLKRNTVK